MSSMTSQLVSGKLSHAEEVENEVKLRKNVAIARRQLKEKLTKNAEEREQHSSQVDFVTYTPGVTMLLVISVDAVVCCCVLLH